MLNQKNYVLSLSRRDVIDLLITCESNRFTAELELEDTPEIDDCRRRDLSAMINKWQTLRDNIRRQLDTLDALNI